VAWWGLPAIDVINIAYTSIGWSRLPDCNGWVLRAGSPLGDELTGVLRSQHRSQSPLGSPGSDADRRGIGAGLTVAAPSLTLVWWTCRYYCRYCAGRWPAPDRTCPRCERPVPA
jgi:hypothetical protein